MHTSWVDLEGISISKQLDKLISAYEASVERKLVALLLSLCSWTEPSINTPAILLRILPATYASSVDIAQTKIEKKYGKSWYNWYGLKKSINMQTIWAVYINYKTYTNNKDNQRFLYLRLQRTSLCELVITFVSSG